MIDSPNLTEIQWWKAKKALASVPYRKRAKNARVVTGDKYLSPDEITRLIEASPERTGLAIQLLADTGLRVSEAMNITLADCRVKGGKVEIRVVGKGSKVRKVAITATLYVRIRETFNGSRYLFETRTGNRLHDRNVAKEITRLGEKHLQRHVTPHMLRHSFATSTIARTGKTQAVSEYLGNSTTAITLDMYVHETLSDEDLGIEILRST